MSWPRCINADIAISPTHLLNVFGNTNLSGNVTLGNSSVVVQSSGNVGIGTTAPDVKLDVTGNGIDINHSGDAPLRWLTNEAGCWAIGKDADVDKFIISDACDLSVSRFTIDNAGNVGIGTTSPSGKLHVSTLNADNSNINFTVVQGTQSGRIENIARANGTGTNEAGNLLYTVVDPDSGANNR